jgi:hypothetical protein
MQLTQAGGKSVPESVGKVKGQAGGRMSVGPANVTPINTADTNNCI